MPRVVQQPGRRGSQLWLQRLVAGGGQVPALEGAFDGKVTWLSPMPDDDWAEYSDAAFLDRLGVSLGHRPLEDFWPKRGPVWDGLATSAAGDLILVEAKSHIREMVSPPSQASPASKAVIEAAMAEVKAHLKVDPSIDWTGRFYQYANRLAHLYLLRELNGLPAWLLFIHFVGDSEMEGPETREEWEGAIQVMKLVLGLPKRHALSPYILDAFIDVRPGDT